MHRAVKSPSTAVAEADETDEAPDARNQVQMHPLLQQQHKQTQHHKAKQQQKRKQTQQQKHAPKRVKKKPQEKLSTQQQQPVNIQKIQQCMKEETDSVGLAAAYALLQLCLAAVSPSPASEPPGYPSNYHPDHLVSAAADVEQQAGHQLEQVQLLCRRRCFDLLFTVARLYQHLPRRRVELHDTLQCLLDMAYTMTGQYSECTDHAGDDDDDGDGDGSTAA